MSIKNFIPILWSERIDKNLDEWLVYWEFCNHEYEGELKKAGDSVRIQNVDRPTITTTTDGAEITLSDPETPNGTSITLPVKRQSYFNYGIYDVDKAQKVGNLESVLSHEVTQGIANALDLGVAGLASGGAAKKLYAAGSEPKVVAGTASSGEKNVLEILDEAQEKLYENNVPVNETVEIVIPPKFYTLFRRDYAKLDTNNSDILKHGRVGMYGNMVVKLSNNVYSNSNIDYIMVRTKGAIAAVKTIAETEAYRPEKGFKDAVKGLTVWDTKIVRPKEVIVANVKYA